MKPREPAPPTKDKGRPVIASLETAPSKATTVKLDYAPDNTGLQCPKALHAFLGACVTEARWACADGWAGDLESALSHLLAAEELASSARFAIELDLARTGAR